MPDMRNTLVNKLTLGALLAGYTLFTLGAAPDVTAADSSIWQALASKMSLNAYRSNESVQQKIRWYVAHREVLQSFGENAQPYIYYVSQQVEKNGLPMELAYLPMIESSYQPNVRSSAKALGLWQLEPGTARGLGVHVNSWYDGRKDVVSSTHAALTYLAYLHSYFHNWPLALAAYNAGIGTVSKAIAYNKAHHRATDFWSLPLPKETRDYVPKLLAVAAIFSNPAAYHVTTLPVANQAVVSPVTLTAHMPLTHFAQLANTDMRTLLRLNPGISSGSAQLTKNLNVLVPADKAAPLAVKLAAAQANTSES